MEWSEFIEGCLITILWQLYFAPCKCAGHVHETAITVATPACTMGYLGATGLKNHIAPVTKQQAMPLLASQIEGSIRYEGDKVWIVCHSYLWQKGPLDTAFYQPCSLSPGDACGLSLS